MEEKKYIITLSDGTEIKNLRLNGNNFISTTPLDESIFKYNCSSVVINDGENSEIHENMTFVQLTQVKDDYLFILRDLTADELRQIKMQSDIEYIAMMTGIDM